MRHAKMFVAAGLFAGATDFQLPAQSSGTDLSHEIAEVMSRGRAARRTCGSFTQRAWSALRALSRHPAQAAFRGLLTSPLA